MPCLGPPVGSARAASATGMLRGSSTPITERLVPESTLVPVQVLGELYAALGLIERAKCLQILDETYGAAVRYCDRAYWGDSSNKLSWIIPELAQLLPDAKFVHLVRDGRKVAGSYFRKLGDECYDDRSNAAMQARSR